MIIPFYNFTKNEKVNKELEKREETERKTFKLNELSEKRRQLNKLACAFFWNQKSGSWLSSP
jgi:hypothetical protein